MNRGRPAAASPVFSCFFPFTPAAPPPQTKAPPLEAQELSPPQASGQLHVVEFKYTALLCLPQEGSQLLHWKRFHLSVLHLRQGTALSGVCGDELLLSGQLHG